MFLAGRDTPHRRAGHRGVCSVSRAHSRGRAWQETCPTRLRLPTRVDSWLVPVWPGLEPGLGVGAKAGAVAAAAAVAAAGAVPVPVAVAVAEGRGPRHLSYVSYDIL